LLHTKRTHKHKAGILLQNVHGWGQIHFYNIYIYINEGIYYHELEARILCITGHGKHYHNMQELVELSGNLMKDIFFYEQDITNIVGKLRR
jgi:hypothetical protein